uniref:Uncharacterized protein n=1 Tax=Aplanochytrium stocchinoi TaxID=215587 RepID=A0A7S3PSS1_9STRA|mmetsp:Transcript_20381/g.24688  ORF Transcript_20381/g.24688 Transcript_20381/m.24688 type:complete len:178 (+) Transcript_20381:446-979(+)|eukprot:CAMPEP_0204829410 /NCGR_PEP_ID=MMETSP1346-20131115/7548_1 /ASSEMBLY_ACC=CAM_ASM_000771 /TAXON_ID=215587 /ORGANISM="Aplanochytrium stocchinoi, Strain GSBS06" /LENGTH=177 /DNA_ID=CAMNT_0051959169 /DNA_START=409 /DNA_END=942 /DNA_ORIENTATION=-
MIGSGKVHHHNIRRHGSEDKIPGQPGLLSRDCKLWDYAEGADDTVQVIFKSLKPPVSVWIDLDAGTFNIENEQGDFNGYVSFKDSNHKCFSKHSGGKYRLQQEGRDKPVHNTTVGSKERKQREVQRRMGRRRPSTMEGIQAATLLGELEEGFEIHETNNSVYIHTSKNKYSVKIAPI